MEFVQRRYAYVLALSTMVIFGALDMLKGVAAPLMQQDWQLSYLQIGNIFAANSLGYLGGSFIAGACVQRLGTRVMLLTGGTVLGISLFFTVDLQSYMGLISAFLVGGIANGWLEIAINHVVPTMTDNQALQAKYFNWLHGLYGVGAVIFPVLAGLLIRFFGGWHLPYEVVLVLVFCLVLGTLGLRQHATVDAGSAAGTGGSTAATATADSDRPAATRRSDNRRAAGSLYRSGALYALIIAITVYVMAEMGIGSWLTTYLVRVQGYSVSSGSYILSAFYFTFTAGRLLAHLWVPKVGNERAVILSAVVGAVLVTVGMLSHLTAPIGFALAGAGFAVIFPTITAAASYRYRDQSGRVLGALFTAAGVGSLSVNWLIGVISTTWGMRAGLGMVIVFLCGVLVTMLWARKHLSEETTSSARAEYVR